MIKNSTLLRSLTPCLRSSEAARVLASLGSPPAHSAAAASNCDPLALAVSVLTRTLASLTQLQVED